MAVSLIHLAPLQCHAPPPPHDVDDDADDCDDGYADDEEDVGDDDSRRPTTATHDAAEGHLSDDEKKDNVGSTECETGETEKKDKVEMGQIEKTDNGVDWQSAKSSSSSNGLEALLNLIGLGWVDV